MFFVYKFLQVMWNIELTEILNFLEFFSILNN